ncbi:MAG: acyltransferase family protein [Verrucomicrobiales bacterium]
MMTQHEEYRNDIDGLRAIAVLAVIVFHFGFLPNGYLGVDVFFVISGFLITGIIMKKIDGNRFSIMDFYLRRTRRIIPLSLFVSMVALIIGIKTMLPDDLENLAQSVIATNFFSNNILQAVTTRNYWDVVNEYKPLMHTWSLGVEEQYYLVYPFLISLVAKYRASWLLPVISTLAALSLTLYLLPHYEHFQKFYLIFFRFWELAAGGIAAILLRGRLVRHQLPGLVILLLVAILCLDLSFIPDSVKLPLAVLLTTAVLITSNGGNRLSSFLIENRIMVALGRISFSLYMWHQLLLAYARYFWAQELHASHLVVIFLLTVALSALSYFLIEQPFRNKNRIGTKAMLLALASVFLLTSAASGYIYRKGGVLKDVPELGISKTEAERNIHAKYNKRVFAHDKPFASSGKTKVLVIGNSFARDWVNVLLESKFAPELEISYIEEPATHKDLKVRVAAADVVFYSEPRPKDVRALSIPESKLWAVGTKSFGNSNGIFYNHGKDGYFEQRTPMQKGNRAYNEMLRKQWGGKYLDLVGRVIDENETVPVFTPSRQFISHDCRHFTKAGARYFAELFKQDLSVIFEKAERHQ